LSEIGPIEMELPECRPSGTFARKWTKNLYLIVSPFLVIAFCIMAYDVFESAPPGGTGAALGKISLWFLGLLGYLALIDPCVAKGDYRESCAAWRQDCKASWFRSLPINDHCTATFRCSRLSGMKLARSPYLV
jgi:hypothetical protein